MNLLVLLVCLNLPLWTRSSSEVDAVDPVLLHLGLGRFFLPEDVSGELPHRSRPTDEAARVLGRDHRLCRGVRGHGAQTRQVQTAGVRRVAA